MLNVLMATIGSAGDLHPLVGLGQRLRQRGHRVSLMTSPHHQPTVQAAGLDFAPLGTAQDYLAVVRNPDIWHPKRGPRLVARTSIEPSLQPLFDYVRERRTPGNTVLAGSSLCFGLRIARDHFRVPMASVHLQPTLFASIHRPPHYPGLPNWPWLPTWWHRTVLHWADAIWNQLAGRPINRFRAGLGLPPARHLITRYVHSPDRVLGLFPAWFAPPQPDWPARTVLTGFPLYDAADVHAPDERLATFLADGPPPVVISMGSANVHAARVYAAALAACRALGRRALLLTSFPEQLPARLPPDVLHVPYAPFSAVLPRAAAFIHHGGIGTLAQALRAGVPQVIVPLSHDQFDNADRVVALGAGRSVSRFGLGRRLTGVLGNVLADGALRTAAAEVPARFTGPDALDAASDQIEQVARDGPAPDPPPGR